MSVEAAEGIDDEEPLDQRLHDYHFGTDDDDEREIPEGTVVLEVKAGQGKKRRSLRNKKKPKLKTLGKHKRKPRSKAPPSLHSKTRLTNVVHKRKRKPNTTRPMSPVLTAAAAKQRQEEEQEEDKQVQQEEAAEQEEEAQEDTEEEQEQEQNEQDEQNTTWQPLTSHSSPPGSPPTILEDPLHQVALEQLMAQHRTSLSSGRTKALGTTNHFPPRPNTGASSGRGRHVFTPTTQKRKHEHNMRLASPSVATTPATTTTTPPTTKLRRSSRVSTQTSPKMPSLPIPLASTVTTHRTTTPTLANSRNATPVTSALLWAEEEVRGPKYL